MLGGQVERILQSWTSPASRGYAGLKFWQAGDIAGTKESVAGAIREVSVTSRVQDPVSTLQSLLGNPAKASGVRNTAGGHVSSINATVHPSDHVQQVGRLGRRPARPRAVVLRVSRRARGFADQRDRQEIIAIARQIMTVCPEVDLSGIIPKYDWYIKSNGPGIADKTDLMTAIRRTRATRASGIQ